MEETEQQLKVVMPWSEVLILAMIGGLIVYHASHPENAMALGLLTIILVVKGFFIVTGLVRVWQNHGVIAQSVLLQDPIIIALVKNMYPFAWNRIVMTLIYGGAGLYIAQAGLIGVGLFVITPFIAQPFVYNRILKSVGSPALQELVDQTLEFEKAETQRNEIFNEEINKVMPEVWNRTKERWKEAGLFTEEMHEHNEPVESDSDSESKTSSDD